MPYTFMLKKYSKAIVVIVLTALLVRVVFVLFGAELYYGKQNFFETGDTYSYTQCAKNLAEHGTFRGILDDPKSVAARLPAYPLLMTAVYLISGNDVDLMYQIMIWIQIVLDVASVFILYQLCYFISKSYRLGIVTALIYALYPFAIIWVPLISSETMGIFTMLLGLMFLARKRNKTDFLFGGVFIALSALCRPQNLIFIPVFVFVYLLYNIRNLKFALLPITLALIGFSGVYGSWITRNYILLDKFIPFSDSQGGMETFSKDVVACRKYIYSLQSDWNPQFFQIVRNEKVEWPEIAFVSKEDSLMLLRAEYLAKNCGYGFSYWREYWNKDNAQIPFEESCCDSIVYYFSKLRANQIKANPFHYKIIIPLQNLRKALFKTSLVNEKQGIFGLATTLLFLYRSLLILIGFIGVYLMMRKKNLYGLFVFLFFAVVYYYICFTVRNIEMRYFLNNDILMLIPASWVIVNVYKWVAIKRRSRKPEQFAV
ncbi:MAG TPA: hypothetical protein PLP11_07340 [Bacteroidales bacterium]|nr:hypothetical protein [Bacteroidales bacterium]